MKQEKQYESPLVEVIEVKVENGFEGSGSAVSDFKNGGFLGEDIYRIRITKLLQKSGIRKNEVIELIYRGFI